MRFGELIEGLDTIAVRGPLDVEVLGLGCDSREIAHRWAFVALKGEKTDGVDFVPKALEAGASVILCDRDIPLPASVGFALLAHPREGMAEAARRIYGCPDETLPVIAVTGTNGKTTTTTLIRQLFLGSGRSCGLIGTVMNAAGAEEVEATRTSPESPVFYRWLRKSLDAGDSALAIETSSHAFCLGRIHGARFKVGLFTNLTQDHLDFHGDMESYFQAKCRLFQQADHALVNGDDVYGQRLMAERPGRSRYRSYGIDREADYHAENVQLSPTGTCFRLHTPEGIWDIQSPLLGRFNVYNLLSALAAIAEAGFSIADVLPSLQRLTGAPGRLDRVDCGQPFGVMVDYAHTPDALEKLMAEGRRLLPSGGRLHVLFGCGGDRDRAKRPIMAAAVAKGADVIWHTSDNTRFEDPEQILDDASAGIPEVIRRDRARYHRLTDRVEAVRSALEDCRPGDLLLLAGKGHEAYSESKGVKHPYSDRGAVEAVLRGESIDCPWREQP
jgi:UDP-N-acetylmuramoyl-L-alanyl-D-glutamate--2,6-diaminopimelate ligase